MTQYLEVCSVQPHVLKNLMEVLNAILTDVNIWFKPDGITISSMDRRHICLVWLHLEASKFEKYICEKEFKVGVYIGTFLKLLKTSNQDDTLTLKMNSDDETTLKVFFHNAERGSEGEYDLNLLCIDEKQVTSPGEKKFHVVIQMPSQDLNKIFKDLQQFLSSESLTIYSQGETLVFQCSATEIGTAKRTFSVNNCAKSISAKYTEEVSAEEKIGDSYSLKYLNMLAKASNLSPFVSLSLRKDWPLMMSYDIALGTLRFVVAPKTKEEGDMELE